MKAGSSTQKKRRMVVRRLGSKPTVDQAYRLFLLEDFLAGTSSAGEGSLLIPSIIKDPPDP